MVFLYRGGTDSVAAGVIDIGSNSIKLLIGEPVEGDDVRVLFFGFQAAATGTKREKPAHGHMVSGFQIQRPEDDAEFVLGDQILDLETSNHGRMISGKRRLAKPARPNPAIPKSLLCCER